MPRCHPPWPPLCSSPALDDDALWARPPQALSSKLSLGKPPFLLPVQVAYRQSKAKTDAVDPEATPKTGGTGSSQWQGRMHRDMFGQLGPPISYLLSQLSQSFHPSLDSLEAFVKVLWGLPLQEAAHTLTVHDGLLTAA